jgi:hypothetical protein
VKKESNSEKPSFKLELVGGFLVNRILKDINGRYLIFENKDRAQDYIKNTLNLHGVKIRRITITVLEEI